MDNINNQYFAVFYLRYRIGKALTLVLHSVMVEKQKIYSQASTLTKHTYKHTNDTTQKGLQNLEGPQVAVLNYTNRQEKMFSLLILADLI